MEKFKFYRGVGPTRLFKPTVAPPVSHLRHGCVQKGCATQRAAQFSLDHVTGVSSHGPAVPCLSPSASLPIKGPPWRGETSFSPFPPPFFELPCHCYSPPVSRSSDHPFFDSFRSDIRQELTVLLPLFCFSSPTPLTAAPHLTAALCQSPVSSLF
jgi:hypothetical protein